jgi:hypothetical protein
MTTHLSRWGESGPRPTPLARNAELFAAITLTETIDVACEQADAWQLVCDIGRIGEFSPECVGARWLDDASGPAVGARFEGTNRVIAGDDEVIWIRPCTVSAFTDGEQFAYVVGDRFDGTGATEWEFRIDGGTEGTCRITQTFRHLPDGLSGLRSQADAQPEDAAELVRGRTESLRSGMRQTLERMRACLAG